MCQKLNVKDLMGFVIQLLNFAYNTFGSIVYISTTRGSDVVFLCSCEDSMVLELEKLMK